MNDAAIFWNKLAEKYARQPVKNPQAFERKIATTLARMTPRDVVLDIGCGTGSLALRLATSGARIHALDLSSEMIRIAAGKAKAAGIENVSFHVGPFDDTFTAFDRESLDGICAYSLLHLVEDRGAVLGRILHLLKPGGFFVSSTLCLGESWVPLGPILSVMRAVDRAPTVKIFRKQTLTDEVAQAGFIDVVQPDVGAKPDLAFIVATKPG